MPGWLLLDWPRKVTRSFILYWLYDLIFLGWETFGRESRSCSPHDLHTVCRATWAADTRLDQPWHLGEKDSEPRSCKSGMICSYYPWVPPPSQLTSPTMAFTSQCQFARVPARVSIDSHLRVHVCRSIACMPIVQTQCVLHVRDAVAVLPAQYRRKHRGWAQWYIQKGTDTWKVQTKPTRVVSTQWMLVRCDLLFDDAQRKAWDARQATQLFREGEEEMLSWSCCATSVKNSTPNCKAYCEWCEIKLRTNMRQIIASDAWLQLYALISRSSKAGLRNELQCTLRFIERRNQNPSPEHSHEFPHCRLSIAQRQPLPMLFLALAPRSVIDAPWKLCNSLLRRDPIYETARVKRLP